jgi:hypothetical protein
MRKFFAILAVLVAAFGLASCSSSPEPRVEHTQENAGTLSANPSEFAYDGEGGRTVLDLLQERADEIGVVGVGAQAFVTSINGVEADQSKNEFWALYVDGEAAQTGAGSLVTETGQKIEWRLETFR